MKTKEQRKAFEVWFESKYDAHFMQFALDLGLYVDNHTQTCWEAWLASANREGYKLVPVVDSDAMWSAGRVIIEENGYCTDASDVYKAMIGACDE